MVRDNNLIQHTTTADNFVANIEARAGYELVFMGEISLTIPTFPVQNLLPKAARIIYASVTASEARELLVILYDAMRSCTAFSVREGCFALSVMGVGQGPCTQGLTGCLHTVRVPTCLASSPNFCCLLQM